MRSVHSSAYQMLLDRLRQARHEAGLTQAQVAEAVRRPQSFVSKSESGERRLDPIELAELAELYAKPVGFFVSEVGGADASGASVSREGEAERRRSAPPRSSKPRKRVKRAGR
jgi:transcriptional regulator with XRE-family HTH domain